jgi:hypothetical protein
MNKTLLENEVFKKEVAGIIDKYWNCACVMNTFGSYWELVKFKAFSYFNGERNCSCQESENVTS